MFQTNRKNTMWESTRNGSQVSSVRVRLRKMQTGFFPTMPVVSGKSGT